MAKSQPKKQRSKQEIVNQIKQDTVVSSHSDKETISFAWCDGGMVEGRFASGIMNTMLEANRHGVKVVSSIRVQGNQIARQRQSLIDYWYDNMNTDWLMWVDSDIVMTMDAFMLCGIQQIKLIDQL